MEKSKKRVPFTDVERQKLREHHKTHPSLTHLGLSTWFEHEFGRRISASSTSEILSAKYSYLDEVEATKATRKKRGPKWAELENALFQYWHDAQPRHLTGAELRSKATEIWGAMLAGPGKPPPSFSDGWLTNWRVKHGLGRCEKITARLSIKRPLIDEGIADIYGPDTPSRKRQRITGCSMTSEANQVVRHSFGPNLLASVGPGLSPCRRNNELSPYTMQQMSSGIKRLSRLYFDQRAENVTIPGYTVLEIFGPLFNTASAYIVPINDVYSRRNMVNEALIRQEAISYMISAEEFQLQSLSSEASNIVFDQWLIDWINPRCIRSPSPEPISRKKELLETSTVGASTDDVVLLRSQERKRYTGISSCFWGRYKVDIVTRKRTRIQNSSEYRKSEEFYSRVVITPLASVAAEPQTIFRFETEMPQQRMLTSIPRISFRNIRLKESNIFKIARFGSSVDLEIALSKGEGSLNDCDPEGRSLINFALNFENLSVVKYLLPKIEEIDAFEVDISGHLRPLIELLALNYLNGAKQDQAAACLRLMLSAGADPCIPSRIGWLYSRGVFVDILRHGSLANVRALLDEGQAFVNIDSVSTDKGNINPLQQLCSEYPFNLTTVSNISGKINLFLERGADVYLRNRQGKTCLHAIFDPQYQPSRWNIGTRYGLKDALMSLVSAGADVNTSTYNGDSVSDFACRHGYEEVWIEVLAECGYDPQPILLYLDSFDRYQSYPGMNCFSVATFAVRPAKLTFKEYCQQRKELEQVRDAAYYESWGFQEDCQKFWDVYLEDSDSEDYEWVNPSERFDSEIPEWAGSSERKSSENYDSDGTDEGSASFRQI